MLHSIALTKQPSAQWLNFLSFAYVTPAILLFIEDECAALQHVKHKYMSCRQIECDEQDDGNDSLLPCSRATVHMSGL